MANWIIGIGLVLNLGMGVWSLWFSWNQRKFNNDVDKKVKEHSKILRKSRA